MKYIYIKGLRITKAEKILANVIRKIYNIIRDPLIN